MLQWMQFKKDHPEDSGFSSSETLRLTDGWEYTTDTRAAGGRFPLTGRPPAGSPSPRGAGARRLC